MNLPFNIDVSCAEKTEASLQLKSQDVFTVLMTKIPGYWKHVDSALFPFKTSAFKMFLSVFWSRLCSNQHQGVIIGHIRLVTLLQGSPIGVKITKHLLYYTGVCLVRWFRGISSTEALEFEYKPHSCVPLFLHVQPPASLLVCPLYHLFSHNV